MTAPALTVGPGLSPKQVARFLLEHRIGGTPVVDAAVGLLGIVTEADLLRLKLTRDPSRHQRRDRADQADRNRPRSGR